MKKLILQKIFQEIWLCAFFLALLCSAACSFTKEQEVEGGVDELRSWVMAQGNQLDELSEEEWQQAKEDFRVRVAALESRENKLTKEEQDEFEQMKQRFAKLDDKYELVVERRRVLAPWKADLLGSYAEMSVVNKSNVVEVYTFFLKNVREKYHDWSENGWNMANMVLQDLNKRKSEIDNDLLSEDEVQIKALQMEFAALEAGGGLGS
ncbi:hypothetical protein [Pontibacter sp. SGAir0037]|uniref:hypothetical protein n=1 Tax=Pontibacter sp. SGAir0037 TaxID=2571030 RepID=UPI0010CCFA09|nr:hypothetical protein [Pontibacter sp. SGAir0037]QCR22985.1 hypothetical protein C1N53_11955 [Pontibacter sp. SGAir0037]